MKEEEIYLSFLTRKLLVIASLSVINFIIGAVLSNWVNKFALLHFRHTDGKVRSFLRLYYNIAIIAIFAYFLRQISQRVPLNFLATDHFNPYRVKEIKTSVLTAFTLFMFFGDTIKEYRNNLF